MAQTPEGKVKDAVKKVLQDRGAYYFMPATGGYGRSGVADIVACYRGCFVAIECKAEGNEATALQLREQRAVHAAKGISMVLIGLAQIRVLQNVLDLIDLQKGI